MNRIQRIRLKLGLWDNIPEQIDIEEYNDEPVFYCKDCLSLKIMGDDLLSYCDDCGSICIGEASIGQWESIYKMKYNQTFIERENGRKREQTRQAKLRRIREHSKSTK